MLKLVIDCETGKQAYVELTKEEMAEIEKRQENPFVEPEPVDVIAELEKLKAEITINKDKIAELEKEKAVDNSAVKG